MGWVFDFYSQPKLSKLVLWLNKTSLSQSESADLRCLKLDCLSGVSIRTIELIALNVLHKQTLLLEYICGGVLQAVLANGTQGPTQGPRLSLYWAARATP